MTESIFVSPIDWVADVEALHTRAPAGSSTSAPPTPSPA